MLYLKGILQWRVQDSTLRGEGDFVNGDGGGSLKVLTIEA